VCFRLIFYLAEKHSSLSTYLLRAFVF
jgi:hypothetical protein